MNKVTYRIGQRVFVLGRSATVVDVTLGGDAYLVRYADGVEDYAYAGDMADLDLTEAIALANAAHRESWDFGVGTDFRIERAVEAAAPSIERQVRDRIAAEIEAFFPDMHAENEDCPDCAAMHWAAQIARGE